MLAIEPNDRNEASEQAEPIDSTDPDDPIDRTDPAEPMDRIDPAEPIDKMDPLEPMLRIEPSAFPFTRMMPLSQHAAGAAGPARLGSLP
jgi:hypothetical protein